MAVFSAPQPFKQWIAFLTHQVNVTSNPTEATKSSTISGNTSGKTVGLIVAVLFLLTLAALICGLTLAVCSLDMAWLHVLSTTGCEKQRNQSLVVARIRRRTSWFLCSMIICSVACTSSIPIIIRDIVGSTWLPILVSTLAVAILAELLPQYYIPRQAIFWGYYCWPIIWICMWTTCVVSWPLSILLDTFAGPLTNKGVMTLDQIAVLIKYHERSEKHGGIIGPDAGRIARSALMLDGQKIRGRKSDSAINEGYDEVDVEKDAVAAFDIIIRWPTVKHVNINDEVSKEFIQRIRGWAYSRILVIGEGVRENCQTQNTSECWNGQKLYGFLHVKNLLGIASSDQDSHSNKLLVKDLPLYPLPVVREDLPIYDLLSLFQLGMSRIAVVIPAPRQDQIVPLDDSEKNADTQSGYQVPLWSAANGLNNRHVVEMRGLNRRIDWTTDFLNAAQNNVELPAHHRKNIIGIGCPEPLGIVTYEDILEALLQKTIHDEKDFFDRTAPLKRSPKEGDASSVMSTHSVIRTRNGVPAPIQKSHGAFERSVQNSGILRRRQVSMPPGGHDGAGDSIEYGVVARFELRDDAQKNLADDSSSYTDNSQGGFHGDDKNDHSVRPAFSKPVLEPVSKSALSFIGVKPLSLRATSSPATMVSEEIRSRILDARPGHRSFDMSLPKLRRVTSFSSFSFAIHEELPHLDNSKFGVGLPSAITTLQKYPIEHSDVPQNVIAIDNHCKGMQRDTDERASLWSFEILDTHAATSAEYELLPSTPNSQILVVRDFVEEKMILELGPGTMPSPERRSTDGKFKNLHNKRFPIRDQSFHDDRALLPSQNKVQDFSRPNESNRCASLWF